MHVFVVRPEFGVCGFFRGFMAVYGLSIYAYEYVVLSMKSSNGDFVVGSVSLRHSSPYGEIHSKMKKYSEYLCIIHK